LNALDKPQRAPAYTEFIQANHSLLFREIQILIVINNPHFLFLRFSHARAQDEKELEEAKGLLEASTPLETATKEEQERIFLQIKEFFDGPKKEENLTLFAPSMASPFFFPFSIFFFFWNISNNSSQLEPQFMQKLEEFRRKMEDPAWKKGKDEQNATFYTLKDPVFSIFLFSSFFVFLLLLDCSGCYYQGRRNCGSSWRYFPSHSPR
jgi:hypothetical protein